MTERKPVVPTKPTVRYRVGEVFRCPGCGKSEAVTKPHEELVAEYEILFGKEWDPAEAVMVCDVCTDRIIRGK